MKDDRKSRGCGFVTFRDSESAEKVVNELNGKKLPHRKLLHVYLHKNKDE